MKTVNRKKLKLNSLLSVLVIVLGFIVLLYGILVEGEPTLVALLLILGGGGWYFITRARVRSQHGPG